MAKTSDRNGKNGNGRLFTTQQSLDSYDTLDLVLRVLVTAADVPRA